MKTECTTCGNPMDWEAETNPYCCKKCFDDSPAFKSWLTQLEKETEIGSRADTGYY